MQQSAHRAQKLIGSGEDHLGGRPDAHVSALRQGEIALPVPLLRDPPSVMRAAVALDDQPPVHDEVHPPHPLDHLLDLDRHSETSHQQARERFRSRLGPPIYERSKYAILFRHCREDLVQVILADGSEVQGTVECGHRGARGLALQGASEGGHDPDGMGTPEVLPSPVEND